MAVGLITDPIQAEKILNDGSSDLMVIGCEVLENLNWPLCAVQALSGPKNFVNFPKQQVDGHSSQTAGANL